MPSIELSVSLDFPGTRGSPRLSTYARARTPFDNTVVQGINKIRVNVSPLYLSANHFQMAFDAYLNNIHSISIAITDPSSLSSKVFWHFST